MHDHELKPRLSKLPTSQNPWTSNCVEKLKWSSWPPCGNGGVSVTATTGIASRALVQRFNPRTSCSLWIQESSYHISPYLTIDLCIHGTARRIANGMMSSAAWFNGFRYVGQFTSPGSQINVVKNDMQWLHLTSIKHLIKAYFWVLRSPGWTLQFEPKTQVTG